MTTPLTCRDVIGLLLEYLETTLDEELCRRLEQHLEACEPCRAYLATYRRTVGVVAASERVEMPPEMRRLLASVLAERLRESP